MHRGDLQLAEQVFAVEDDYPFTVPEQKSKEVDFHTGFSETNNDLIHCPSPFLRFAP